MCESTALVHYIIMLHRSVQRAKGLVLLFFVLQEDARTYITFPVQMRKVYIHLLLGRRYTCHHTSIVGEQE